MKEMMVKKTILFNQAITAQSDQKEISFYLTKSPHCSSTLKPVPKNLEQWPYAGLFQTVDVVSVPALTISEVLREVGFEYIDWLKVDSQGTDLRILESIPSHIFNQMIACDVEPGLYEHYENADLFPELHLNMIRQGFWLADLKLQTQPRIAEADWNALQEQVSLPQMRKLINLFLKRSPTATEARYIRSIPSAIALNYDYHKFLVLWAISLTTGNLSYAYHVACEIERRFSNAPELRKETYKIITLQTAKGILSNPSTVLLMIIKQLIRKS